MDEHQDLLGTTHRILSIADMEIAKIQLTVSGLDQLYIIFVQSVEATSSWNKREKLKQMENVRFLAITFHAQLA